MAARRLASRMLGDDALRHVRDVLAAVRHGLELLVDGLEFHHLAHVLLLSEQARDRRAHLAVGVAFEPVDLLAGLDDRLGVALLAQQAHQILHALAALLGDEGEALGLGRDAPDVVERDRLGDVLDDVADVVQGRDEPVDVVPVDGRDEGGSQQSHRLGRHAVGGVLGLVDALGVLQAVVEIAHERGELAARAHHLVGMPVEQLVEARFLGHQAAEHGISGERRGRKGGARGKSGLRNAAIVPAGVCRRPRAAAMIRSFPVPFPRSVP